MSYKKVHFYEYYNSVQTFDIRELLKFIIMSLAKSVNKL